MKKLLRSCLILVACCSFHTASLNAQVQSFNELSDGVLFQLSNNQVMKISVCSDNTLRIIYAANSEIPERISLVVVNEPEYPPFTTNEDDQSIYIQTKLLNVIVSKTDAIVGFYDSSGNLLLQEDSKAMSKQTLYGVETNRCVATFNFSADEAVYGLGQHQQSIMNYAGRNQNLEQSNMEIALPILISNKGYGIMWDNYSKTQFTGNLSSSTKYRFSSDAGDLIDYYFLYGPTPDEVIAAYRNLTGTTPLFPKWAYGLFQSMDRYDTAAELLNVSAMYRKKKIPLDCIVQDWQYWSPAPQGSHKMNTTKYPNPKQLIDSLHNINVHTMISIWPVFYEGEDNYKELEAVSHFYPSSGKHHYYDAHSEVARGIYWRQVKENLFGNYGWDAWWADGDEPDTYPDAFDRKTGNTALGKAVLFDNTYPLMHTEGVYKGWRQDIPDKRLFTLSRSAFLGQHRNATACWSGDINSNWTDFKKQLSAGLNFFISGIPYWTTDIGGYWGANWTIADNRELFTRWFQYGTFCPISRIHGKLERTIYSETAWDEVTRNTLIKFDKLRYRLMPYIYSIAWKVTNEHYTMMRPLIMDYLSDSQVFNISNQFLFGPFMMINPVTDRQTFNRSVYFPDGIWYDFWTGETIEGNSTLTVNSPIDFIPVYVKAGSIIPMGPEIEYANQTSDPVEIRIYKGADAQFDWYEDAGDSYKYEEGEYSVIPLTYIENDQTLTIGNRYGDYPGMLANRTFKIVWVEKSYGTGAELPLSCDAEIIYSGSEVKVQLENERTICPDIYEAENANFNKGAEVENQNKGYTGNGYLSISENSLGAMVQFTVRVEKSGNYIVKLRYSSPYDKGRHVDLLSNNVFATTLSYHKTINQNGWNEVAQIVYLQAGENEIAYIIHSSPTGHPQTLSAFYLDHIRLTVPSDPIILDTNLKKIVRIRLHNTESYLHGLADKLHIFGPEVNTPAPTWKIERVEGNYYKISIDESTLCLTVEEGSTDENAPVVLADYNGSDYQQWLIEDYGYGLAKISARHSGKTLSVESGNVIQSTDRDLVSQQWIFENPVQTGTGDGLKGEYYSGKSFNTFVLTRVDPQINFDWGLDAPHPSMPKDYFTVRWTGKVQPQYTDYYTFITRSDDGVRLWVDNQRIINDWTERAVKENRGRIALEANQLYDIKLEYLENEYDACVSLEWECPSLERQLIPPSQLYSQTLSGLNEPRSIETFVDIYPNPTSSAANIRLNLDSPAFVKTELFNPQGILIKAVSAYLDEGMQSILLDVSDLTKGIYWAKTTTNKNAESKKLVIL